MTHFKYNFLSRSINQSTKKPAINGARRYNRKNLWKLPKDHADRNFNAKFMQSSDFSSLERLFMMVIISAKK